MTLEEEETMRARSVSDGWMEKPPFPATLHRAEEKSVRGWEFVTFCLIATQLGLPALLVGRQFLILSYTFVCILT